MILNSYLTPHTKITTRWIINVNGKMTKLPEYSIGEHLHHLGLCKYFLKGQKKARTVMEHINKLGFIESKNIN